MKNFVVVLLIILICLTLVITSFSETKKVVIYGDAQNLVPVQWLIDEAKEKGIEIQIAEVPFTSAAEKLKTEFMSQTGAYDLVVMYPSNVGEYADFNYIMPLDPFLKIADPHLEDVIPAYMGLYCEYTGKIYALPIDGDVLSLYYLKDIFNNEEEKANFEAEYGYKLTVSETWDQLADVAKFFTRKKGEKLAGKVLDYDFYGFGIIGARRWAYAWWSTIFASYGGNYFDRDMNPQINSEDGVRALEYLKSMLQYCPPDVLSYGYVELKDAYLLGRLATMIQWSDIWKKAQDPKMSKIVGNAGIAVMPGVLKEDGTIYYRASAPCGRVLGIPSNAKHPEEAYWIAYMLSDTLSGRAIADPDTGLDPYRYSHFNNLSAFKDIASEDMAKEYLNVVQNNLKQLFPDLSIPGSAEYLDILDIAVTTALAGDKTPQKALDDAAKKWDELTDSLDRERQKKIYNNMLDTWKEYGFWKD